MKIIFFLLLNFCVFFIPDVYGQMTMIGVRAGVNLANEKYENLPDGETISLRVLLLGGAQVDYRFTNSLAISLQILFDQKGAHAESQINFLSASTADWTISYLEVPILLKAYLGSSIVRPYLFGGTSICLLLRNIEQMHMTTSTIANGPPPSSTTKDTLVNITDSTAKFDFSLIAGVGVSLTLTSGVELFLDAGYAFGLVNIDKYYNDNKNDYYIHSRDIRIAVGILFPIY